MRISAVAFLMILTTVFLSSCTQEKKAAVLEDRSNNFYGRNGVAPLTQQSAIITQASAPVEMVASAPVTPTPVAAPLSVAPVKSDWQWPVVGKLTEHYGDKQNGIVSEGITIAATEGEPIRAAQAGEVIFVGQNLNDYGNMVILRHADGTMSSYAHARNLVVAKGDQLHKGSVLGYVGHTGDAKTSELHFAMRVDDRTIDPLTKLPQLVAAN